MRLLRIFRKIWWTTFKSPEAYARHIGVNLGKGCLVGTRNWGSEPYLITVGDNVQLTGDIHFHTHGGAHVARRKHPDFDIFGKIVIKDNAYIGTGSRIMPGVTIGKGALVAAGSVVTKSVPDGEVWGGIPAARICTVDEYIERNLPYNTHTAGMAGEAKRRHLLSLPDSAFIRK